jgi:hypothetical protein
MPAENDVPIGCRGAYIAACLLLASLAPCSTDPARVKAGREDGTKPKLTAHQQRDAIKRRDAGEPVCEIARSYAVSHSTISTLAT